MIFCCDIVTFFGGEKRWPYDDLLLLQKQATDRGFGVFITQMVTDHCRLRTREFGTWRIIPVSQVVTWMSQEVTNRLGSVGYEKPQLRPQIHK